eukprot:506122_1
MSLDPSLQSDGSDDESPQISTTTRNKSITPYGFHEYDKHYWISRSKREWKGKSITRTAYFELKPTFVFDKLGMSRNRLKLFNLQKVNHSYVRGRYSIVELEKKVLENLENIRNHIGWMLDMKGNVPGFGYSDLNLGDGIIAARLCYEKSFANQAYYYGDDDGSDSEENCRPFFIMRSEDHWIERYIGLRDIWEAN